ncbi:hypothetical protein Fmac_006048 [Flemingia macrophylla]|uniref:Uncharacterized protein n=1 Tax=Flemingia macrophylla TaxID=520843 RepID=A0ABD1NAY4_9FABA
MVNFALNEVRIHSIIASSSPNLEHLHVACTFDPRYIGFVGDETLLAIPSNCPKLSLLHLADTSSFVNRRGIAGEDTRVRNEEKARRMLGSDVDLVVGDITKDSTLIPEYFKGVKKVINVASVIVGPKEGDTPERANCP